MADEDYRTLEQVKEARRLRELFKGRFSERESQELLDQHGSLAEAVEFVLSGDPSEVRKFINDRNQALVPNLRRDSEYVNAALQEGLDSSIRLFACQPCDRYWWRKVPARKEVSKCKVCRQKYDPVPREEEWGLGEFVCVCGNVFWGTAWMNHTQSPCYKCGFQASPRSIRPPSRRQEPTFSRSRHSCTGGNCYNRARGTPAFNRQDRDAPVCPHEQSVRRNRVLYPSNPHVSTGSTVNSFMSQGDLAEDYDDLEPMPSVYEGEED